MMTVLVIDDHFHTHRLLQPHLTRLGIGMLDAYDGETGLATARAEKPDLILLDITMPRLDGLSVLRELKAGEDTRAIPIVMLTAQSDPYEVTDALTAGAAGYVAKPFHPVEVAERIQKLLESGQDG